MNPKNYFDRPGIKNGMLKHAEKMSPLYQRYFLWFKGWVQQRPKLILLIMLLIVALNFTVMLYVVNTRKAPSLTEGLRKGSKMITNPASHINGGPEFSLGNYFRISKLKDSLEYYMNKKHKTTEDTLAVIRIFEAYQKMDPALFKVFHENLWQPLDKSNEKENLP